MLINIVVNVTIKMITIKKSIFGFCIVEKSCLLGHDINITTGFDINACPIAQSKLKSR